MLSDFITVLRLVESSTSVTFNGFYNSFGACVHAASVDKNCVSLRVDGNLRS